MVCLRLLSDLSPVKPGRSGRLPPSRGARGPGVLEQAPWSQRPGSAGAGAVERAAVAPTFPTVPPQAAWSFLPRVLGSWRVAS